MYIFCTLRRKKMKACKCISCGANIEVDENKEAGVCPFCNTPYVTEKVIKSTNTTNTTNNSGTIINYFYGYSDQANNTNKIENMVPPRPKINVLLAIICFWLYIIPGILYVSNIRKKQEE